MRQLLCIALLLLYCTCGCFAAVVMRQLPQKGQSGLQTYTVSTTTKEANDKSGPEWHPIRIGVYTKYVDDAVRYCKGEDMSYDEIDKENGVEIDEEFEELCKADNMTEEKKSILFNDVLPKAIKLHTDRLKVKPVKESPRISNDTEILEEGCYIFSAPLKRKVRDSAVVDFMIYVGLSITYESVSICSQDVEKRPTSAVIKFVPKEIIASRMYIRLTAHEIAHALGLQFVRMTALGMIDIHRDELAKKAKTKSVIPFYMVKSSKTVEMLKKYYNCEEDGEVKGLYLENGNGGTPSHWERRIAKDELMSTYIGESTSMYYSVLTLGVFHDMPYYSANFSMAEPMSWGNKSGCKFLQGGEKDSADTDYPKMFCKEDVKILQCTSDRFALGMCFTKNNRDKLPKGYKYFTKDYGYPVNDLMDDYPIIKSLIGTACEDDNETLMPGSLLGSESRCLNVNALKLKDNRDDVTVHGICAKVKCEGGKVHVQYKGMSANEWHKCENESSKIELRGDVFNGGSIVCPEYNEVCTGLPETEPPTITFYNGTQDHDADDTLVDEDDEEEEEEDIPLSPPPTNADDVDVVVVEKEAKVPIVNDNNRTQVDTKPESAGDNLPQVPTNTSKEEKKKNDNETVVVAPPPPPPPTITTTTTNDSVNPSVDTTTAPSDESHHNVSDNSNANEIPPHNMDSSQKDDSSKPGNAPETKDSQKGEIPPKEEGSSKPESSDNNEREKETTDGKVENTNNRTGVNSWKDSDNSIAISFFGPLMLLVCAVAAVVSL